MSNFKKGLFPIILVMLLFFGLIMLEPDFGTGMVIVLTLIGMIFVSKSFCQSCALRPRWVMADM